MTAPDTDAARESSNPPGFVRALQRVDHALGLVEQAALALLLAVLIGIGAYQALGRNFFDHSPLWTYDALRYSVFFIAMTGAALSAQTRQLIRMDVVTRALSPRGRAIARLATGLFTIIICGVLIYAGLQLRGVLLSERDSHLISSATVSLAIPIGAGLIAFHIFVQFVAFASALVRGDAIEEDTQAMH